MKRRSSHIGTGAVEAHSHGWISRKTAIAAFIVLAAALAPSGFAQRTRLKPGWNIFSPQQDLQIGQEVSKQAEQQVVLLNNQKVDSYLDRLGHKLSSRAPGEKYPYQFKCVNDQSINAFALPGGFLYINRGTIEAADNEAQLAGVIGHEIGHAAMRHGTNQMTKAAALQLPLSLLGGVVGSNSIIGLLSQLGANFGAQSLLLKYSRDAERQADIIGTQILYDNNYNPQQMAQFFMKLEEESKKSGSRPIQFFSSHPIPENRVTAVSEEVARMGGHAGSYQDDTAEFREIQRYVRSLPPPPKTPQQPQAQTPSTGSTQAQRPALPSGRFQNYSSSNVTLQYPDNWKPYSQGDSFTLAPDRGLVEEANGNTSIAYGVMTAIFQPQASSDLAASTTQLLNSFRNTNPDLRVTLRSSSVRIDGQPALATTLTGPSPYGGNEIDYLVTVQRPEGLVFFVFVAPERDFAAYQRTFQAMTSSIRFARR